jgi:hypothetical protein
VTARRLGVASAAVLALAACGAGSSLEGSLSDDASLSFDQVQVQRAGDSAIALVYLRSLPAGGGQDTVLKVVANTSGLDLSAGLTIDLAETVGNSARGSVTRAVSDDARRDFPALVRGKLHFDGAPAVGSKATGNFTVTFGQGGSIGSGKTAFGDFSATISEAGQ